MTLLSIFHQVDNDNRRAILELIEGKDGSTIIDLGCGDGRFSIDLAKRARAKKVYGIEFQKETAAIAGDKGIQVCRADLNKRLPFADEAFDAVHANQVIEHLVETDIFIEEIYRILKPGGYAVVSTPNLASLHNIISLIMGKQPFPAHVSNRVILGNSLDPKHGMKHESKGEIHMRIFSPDALIEILEYHGFRIQRFKGVGFYPFPRLAASLLSQIDVKHSVYLTVKARKPI